MLNSVKHVLNNIIGGSSSKTNDGQFSYYDFWNGNPETIWFTRFIRKNIRPKTTFSFYSVLGPQKNVQKTNDTTKIFFSGECLADVDGNKYNPKNTRYSHWLDQVDLSLSFENINHEKYMRFPLWLLYTVNPEDCSLKAIKEWANGVDNARNSKKWSCTMICSHDKHGTRMKIYNAIKDILPIESAGKFMHNTDKLWTDFNNNKGEYLSNFKYNLCAENLNAPYYCTEKIFEAVEAGTVPLYLGANSKPEPEVLNRDKIIMFNMDGNNHDAVQTIIDLEKDDSKYDEFMEQKTLLPTAAEYIHDVYIEQLLKRLKEISQ